MAFIMPEVVVQSLLQESLKTLRANKRAFYDIFSQYAVNELNYDYGTKYIDQIWEWFSTTKIPVIQAWSLNAQVIPCISIHLANETEDEQKSGIGDILGELNDHAESGIAVFTVMLDIGIHANKAGDHVLWLYYITSYLLFKNKRAFERMGLKLQTYSASDFSKDGSKMTDNIWTRWIRFRCTTQNFWDSEHYVEIDNVNTEHTIGGNRSVDIAASLDVDISKVDRTANKGIAVELLGNGSLDDDLD